MQALDGIVIADLPRGLVRLAAFVFGALWGSFFNVAIYRWPRGMSVVKPPSHCPSCGARVRWYLNVPILGYFFLRGRAACCGAKLTPRYAWVEALSAVLCLAVVERFLLRADGDAAIGPAALESLLYFAFVGGLVIVTFVDLEWMEIPDEVALPGAALGLATVGLRGDPGAVSAAVGAGVGFLIVQGMFVWGYELLTGRRGMGEGDAKLLLMIGAFLGWEAVLFALIAGSVQGLIAAGLATALGVPLVPSLAHEDDAADQDARSGAAEPAAAEAGEPEPSGSPMMVFGPMLALSALEFLFFGDAVVAWVALRLGG